MRRPRIKVEGSGYYHFDYADDFNRRLLRRLTPESPPVNVNETPFAR